jgi:hypothetical protein
MQADALIDTVSLLRRGLLKTGSGVVKELKNR